MDAEAYDPPELSLSGITYVIDRKRNDQVMRIKGVVVLPIGAEIELTDPNVNAVVVGIRLLAGNETTPVAVCLDVEVPDAYYYQGKEESGVVRS